MKLLANENFPAASVIRLRRDGYDIVSVGSDFPGITDDEVIALAVSHNRTIITFDRDYGELIHKYNYRPPQGIVYLRIASYTPEEPATIVDRLFKEYNIDIQFTLSVFDGIMLRQRKY